MAGRIDYPSGSNPPQRPSRFPAVLLVLGLLLPVCVLLLRPLPGLLMVALGESSRSLAPGDVPRSVSVRLMRWGVFGAVPDRHPDYEYLRDSIARRMTGINGYIQSDGFHGDGTDWYEVELSGDLAAELRAALGRTAGVRAIEGCPRDDAEPSWWPKRWPADARCYERGHECLVLPDGGTRAWLLRVRT